MTALVRGLALTALLLCPLTASANWLHNRSAPTTTAYYYYPTFAPLVPAIGVAFPVPYPGTALGQPGILYATPTPAPADCPPPMPSVPASVAPAAPVGPAPPPMPHAPGVSESRSSYYSGPAPREAARAVSEQCTVSFWNSADRDLTLKVNGESRLLRRGRGLTLDLPREFTWQIDGRKEQSERVPGYESALQLTIRQ